MVARPVEQSLDGRLVYDVRDTGRQALPGSGVRPDQTNIDLKFHTDNSYNRAPPECVVLLCLRTAKSGGHSRVASFHTLYNALLQRYPEALPRLYRRFWFDRQREFHDGEPEPSTRRFSRPIANCTPASVPTRSAAAMRCEVSRSIAMAPHRSPPSLDLFDDDTLSADFDLEPGQLQFVDNRVLGHARTQFADHPEPERRRHLVRLWLRDHGSRAYTG